MTARIAVWAPPISTKRIPEDRKFLEQLFRVATEAVAPEALIRRSLLLRRQWAVLRMAASGKFRLKLPLCVFGVGKAAARMALGCEQVLGADKVHGFVITADGCEVPLRSIECRLAGHPIPDERGASATATLVENLKRHSGPILFVLSGGASSLLVQPRSPVSLSDKIAVSQLLLASGASVGEFNTVRKHLSVVKGGGLLRFGTGPLYTLILSDVVGDDPAVIGSGPSVPDPTTFADAMDVLRRYALLDRVPSSIRFVLAEGCAGRLSETVKPSDTEARRSHAAVIGSNRLALEAAALEAKANGWRVRQIEVPLQGDTRDAAAQFAEQIEAESVATQTSGQKTCLLAGGETTVKVTGSGRGGRNQEFALALAGRLRGRTTTVLSAGSDGVDGPTDAAGAFVDGTTLERSLSCSMDLQAVLAANDSYPALDRLGDLFFAGPTGTNVMDLKFALIRPALGRQSDG